MQAIALQVQASSPTLKAEYKSNAENTLHWIEITSENEVTASTITPDILEIEITSIADTLFIKSQVAATGVTAHDWSVTNTAGTFSGTYTTGGAETTTQIASGIRAQVAAAHNSLANTTSAANLVTVKSYTQITDFSAEEDLLLAFGSKVEDVLYIFIKQGVSLSDYTWEITNAAGKHTGTITTAATEQKTLNIAAAMLMQIQSADPSLDASVRIGSLIEVRSIFPITEFRVSDDGGDNLMGAFQHEVRSMTELPVDFRDGYRVRVSSDPTTELEDQFVTFTTEKDLSVGPGTWNESTDWELEHYIDPASMPRKLTLEEDDEAGTVTGTPGANYFTILLADWTPRTVGNSTTSRVASFTGEKISGMAFTSNRIVLLSQQNAIASEVGLYFNFNRTTTLTTVDSDRIDIAVNETKLAVLRNVGELDEQLILSSDEAQFVLAGQPLTPATAILNRISSFKVTDLPPISSGSSLFFPTLGSEFAGVLDFFRQEQGAYTIDELTIQVPSYIKGEILLSTSYPQERLAFFKADEDNALFAYKYEWQGRERTQSAWSRWTFGPSANVRYIDFFETEGIVLIERGGDLFLERIKVGDGLTDTDTTFQVCIDRRVRDFDCVVGYSPGPGTTGIDLPYDLDPLLTAADVAVATTQGVELVVTSIGTNRINVQGDHTTTDFWAGQRYTQKITLSEPIPQFDGPTGPIPRSGDFTLHNLEVQTSKTGSFKVQVTPAGMSETFEHAYPAAVTDPLLAAVLSSDALIVGVPSPARGLTVSLVNDTALPSSYTGLVWNGDLSAYRSGR